MRTLLHRYLDTVGDGSGQKNARQNLATPTDYLIRPSADEAYVLESLTVIVRDSGALAPDGYGALPALGTGIDLLLSRPEEVSFLDGILIQRHYDWLTALPVNTPPVDTTSLGETGTNLFIAYLAFPEPLVLSGKYGGHALLARLPAADFSGLEGHFFKIYGYKVANP
ncbi:MAG: hypothetical protein ACO1RX_20140 [Candidatus Sericytochromatia bacterium]